MKEHSMSINDPRLLQTLKLFPVWKLFYDDSLVELLSKVSIKVLRFTEGEKVISEGDMDFRIYWLLQGEVCIRYTNQVLLGCNLFGAMFGEMSVVDDRPKSADIFATKNTTCIAIDFSFFKDLPLGDLNRDRILEGFCKELSRKIRGTNEALVSGRLEFESLETYLKELDLLN